MSASTTPYHNNINTRGQQSNTTNTSTSSCLIPPDLRFPSYSTFSDQKAFLAVTGGDAPWFFPTRSAAMNNSRGFYTRFLENLGKTMTKYCQELEEYNNNKKNIINTNNNENKQVGGKAQDKKCDDTIYETLTTLCSTFGVGSLVFAFDQQPKVYKRIVHYALY